MPENIKSQIKALCSVPSISLSKESCSSTKEQVLLLLEDLKTTSNYSLNENDAINKWLDSSWKEVWSDHYNLLPTSDFIKPLYSGIYHSYLQENIRWNFNKIEFFGFPASLNIKSSFKIKNNIAEFIITNVLIGLQLPQNTDVFDFASFINGGGIWGLNVWSKRPKGVIGLRFELKPLFIDNDFRVDSLKLKNYVDPSGDAIDSDYEFIIVYDKCENF